MATGGPLDVFSRGFAFVLTATRQDNLGCTQTDKVPGRLEAQTGVGTCHDDGLAGEVIVWLR